MPKQESSVTPLAGSQSATPDPLLQAEAAMSEAVAEIEQADGNGRTVAQLIEAREAIRAEYRSRRSAHTLTGSDAIDAIDAQHREQELHKRIDRVLGPGFCAFADYLRTGEPHRGDPYREIIDHATALAEVLCMSIPTPRSATTLSRRRPICFGRCSASGRSRGRSKPSKGSRRTRPAWPPSAARRAAAMSDPLEGDAFTTLSEREQHHSRRFWYRLRDGDPLAERVMRQWQAGELRAREAMMIGGCPRRSA